MQVLISPLSGIFSHFRFILTLRSAEGKYHGLILFRLASNPGQGADADVAAHQVYVMEATCPHLGAEMSHADIEEYEDSVVAVCPWHRYDFDLKTGKSDTGLRTCTYPVEIKPDEEGVESVYMEAPEGGAGWRVVEMRAVSEEFADPPPPPSDNPATSGPTLPFAQEPDEPVVPTENPPKTLMEWAVLILNTPNPTLKVMRTRHAVHAFRTGLLTSIGNKVVNAPRPPDEPPREKYMNTVEPGQVKKRKNRAVMLHALANIEQWAIDLAWDIIARFGPMHKNLPPAFFSDFTKMALDESKHFSLLVSRLAAISPSTPYGSFPVHASLWDSARITSRSFRSRLAIIHLVHEARGLDVNPATIERFRRAGDTESVRVLEIVHADEVTHVTAGHRWFLWICEQGYLAPELSLREATDSENRSESEGTTRIDPVQAFRDEVKQCWRGELKGPFNVDAREKAGLSREFYEGLRGEMPVEVMEEEDTKKGVRLDGGKAKNLAGAEAEVKVGYES